MTRTPGGPKAASDGTIPMGQAALLLMLTEKRIRQLQRDGYIPRAERGRVPLVGVVQGYIRFLTDEEKRAAKTAAESRVRDARAREIELRTARDEQELVPTAEVDAYVRVIVDAMLDRLDRLPAKFTKDSEKRRQLRTAIDDIRSDVTARMERGPLYLGDDA